MATIDKNKKRWGSNSSWQQGGDEWSAAWGGAEKQWIGTILPRIAAYLPAVSVLEIAPGFGRWTQFLREHCERLTGVDLNVNCVEACTTRFADTPRLQFIVNDGRSLDMITDHSIDFIFSFDSLVHADVDVLNAYLSQFPRILRARGAAFIHHSNYAALLPGGRIGQLARLPGIRQILRGAHLFGMSVNWAWRSENVSAAVVRDLCVKHGLHCHSQELINWCGDSLNDCFSLIHSDSCNCAPLRVIENYDFMREAARVKANSPA